MRDISAEAKALALAPARRISARAIVTHLIDGKWGTDGDIYNQNDKVQSLSISLGSNSGGFTIGETYCGKLTLTLIGDNLDIRQDDRIHIVLGFFDDIKGAVTFKSTYSGYFFVDKITRNKKLTTVVAFDKMLRFSKNYISKLTYPALLSEMLAELSGQCSTELADDVAVPYDVQILAVPIKGKDNAGKNVYYTRREMLGYCAALCGSSFFLDNNGKLALVTNADCGETIFPENTTSETHEPLEYEITGAVWSEDGNSVTRDDSDTSGIVEFANPLDVSDRAQALNAISAKIVGLKYYEAVIKGQGKGWYELGDIVSVKISDNETLKIRISGITYEVKNGAFTETLYSSALTESQSNYTSGDVSGSTSNTPKKGNDPLAEYNVISNNSVKFNGVTYTVKRLSNGIISKISDDKGGEFEPTYADGVTDISMHNAAFLAVAMISGLSAVVRPNKDLLIYLSAVPDGFALTIPKLYDTDTSINQIVDWGDDSDPETSTCGSAISHTYTAGGDYTITVKSDSKSFSDNSGGNWNDYLTAIYFPDDALKISYTNSLTNCPKLSAIKLGSAAQEISLNFQNNGQAITALIIPETALNLTFTNLSATGITSLIIPKNVTSIANIGSVPSLTYLEVMCAKTPYVYNSKALTKVVLGENVQTIKEYGFASCSALSEVKFSAAIAKIENGAFQNCTSLKELPLLPNLTSLGSNAFEKCTALAKAEISDGITKILSLTFCGCTSLMSVNIPKNVVEIGQRAFEQVPAPISKDDFPVTLKTIGAKAFYQSGIVSARLISGATYSSEAFAYCSSLTEVAVDDEVLTIPNKCFQYCTSLSSINLPSSVTTIDTAAFEGSGLTNINLPDGLLTINQNAFNKCSLSSVTIPSSVTTLKSNAFSNNLNLTSATINDVGFNVLPSNIFNGCKALTSVNLGRSIDTLEGSNFSDCTSLDDVDLSNIIKIGGFAFSGCSSLKSVSFKSGVVIEGNAFRYAGFTSLILTPFLAELTSGTTSQGGRYNIGVTAFAGCKNLSSVDNYRYKFTVGLKKTEKFLEDDGWRTVETDLGAQGDALGIYTYWGATTDSVFSGTALKSAGDYLKEHPEYKNESTSTYSVTYSAYDIIPS